MPLEQPNSLVLQPAELVFRFNALSNKFYAQINAGTTDPSYDRLLGSFFFNIPHKVNIQFKKIGLKFSEQIQSGISSPKIINGEKKPGTSIIAKRG